MSGVGSEVQNIPIELIRVLNPRSRNKRVFNELVSSIQYLGLKKPITVSKREGETGYDLVCGQGRLEAFIVLGQKTISALVVEASVEDCFVMSLVENLARRNHSPLEFMREIGGLRDRGYSIAQIAKKTAFSDDYVKAICYLIDQGEERLLYAVDKGTVPITIAMEIARAKDDEVQKALAEAYEQKTLPGNQVVAIRKIVEQRNLTGKGIHVVGPQRKMASKITSTALVRAYRKETDRQQLLVKKSSLAQNRLLFIANALRRLQSDETFLTLLKAETLNTMPELLAKRVGL